LWLRLAIVWLGSSRKNVGTHYRGLVMLDKEWEIGRRCYPMVKDNDNATKWQETPQMPILCWEIVGMLGDMREKRLGTHEDARKIVGDVKEIEGDVREMTGM
jgi:hypothetical protein